MFQTYMQQYVFRIPDTVTLPEDRCQLVAPVEHAQKLFDETLERVEMQEKRMLQVHDESSSSRGERGRIFIERVGNGELGSLQCDFNR